MVATVNASTSAGVVITPDNSGVLAFQSSSATALTIDASQNVGIGTSSPSDKLEVSRVSGSNSAGGLSLTNSDASGYGSAVTWRLKLDAVNVVNVGRIYVEAGSATATFMPFQTTIGSTVAERMRIDSSGNLLVGRTTKQADIAGQSTNVQTSTGYSCYDGTNQASFTPTRIYFNGASFYVLNASDTGVRLVNGATSWSAQSDERTKTDLVPIANGLEKVNSLRAVTGRYTKDEESVSRAFLIAQDVKAVLPEAVDEDTDEEKTLGLRYTDVIPLLVSAIKELKAINDTQAETINALTARIVALEGK